MGFHQGKGGGEKAYIRDVNWLTYLEGVYLGGGPIYGGVLT